MKEEEDKEQTKPVNGDVYAKITTLLLEIMPEESTVRELNDKALDVYQVIFGRVI